jgi:hypothetical protein
MQALCSLLLAAGAAQLAAAGPPPPPAPACVATDFGGHHCPLTHLTNLTASSITTGPQCWAACCAARPRVNCTTAQFETATSSCWGGDWHLASSCRKTAGWKTYLINFSPPGPPPAPGPPSPPSPPGPPAPPAPPSPSPPAPPAPPGAIPAAVADKFGAKCLDGTPPTYDVSLNTSSSQWVLFLEGGGWCYGATVAAATTSCASRGGAQWPPHSDGAAYDGSTGGTEGRAPRERGGAAIGGIMSSDPAINPDFHTWNKVFMHVSSQAILQLLVISRPSLKIACDYSTAMAPASAAGERTRSPSAGRASRAISG